MDQDTLMNLLHAHEWRDVEFKEAQRNVPKNAYETVSAFANTDGGHLVFGVRKDGKQVEIVGVLDVDKVQGDFLTTLRQPDKVSVTVEVEEKLLKHDDADLLLFYVPEAHRSEKPVYLNGDIRRAFVRSGASDIRCSENERNRFLMDAATERYDGQPLDFALDGAFDRDSLRWYRAAYEGRAGNRSYAGLADADFLSEMGLLVEQAGVRVPSRAAILLFGANRTLRQILPRPVVDCQRYLLPLEEADTGNRWSDRLILEENLVQAWRGLVDDWYPRIAEHPFRVDPATMQRDDTPPDYLAFREAMVNLLLHQDYADHTRKGAIYHYRDQTVFRNPGDAFASSADLLEPGEKEVRNPHLVRAFRRIGVSENAGWGLRDMFRNWRELGNLPPVIRNDKRRKSFEVVLSKETLLTHEQLAFQQTLGVHLTEDQANAFAYLCRVRSATISEVRAVIDQTAPRTQEVLNALGTQMLVRVPEHGQTIRLARHLESALEEAAKDAVPKREPSPTVPSDAGLDQAQLRIVEACDVPRSVTELADATGLPRRDFRRKHVDPLVAQGLLRMTNPANPTARTQRFVLTDAGVTLKAERVAANRRGQRAKR